MALLLEVRKQVLMHDNMVGNRVWRPSKPDTAELHGKTLGLIGLGATGEQMARIAQALCNAENLSAFLLGRENIRDNVVNAAVLK